MIGNEENDYIIDIKHGLTSTSNTITKEISYCYFELHESCIRYYVKCEISQKNPETDVFEDMSVNNKFTRRKSDISDISLFFCNQDGLYVLKLEFSGVTGGMEFNFKKYAEANTIYQKLVKYTFGI